MSVCPEAGIRWSEACQFVRGQCKVVRELRVKVLRVRRLSLEDTK